MIPRASSEFQNGIIELFKVHKTYDLNIMDCRIKGTVTCENVNKIYLKFFNIFI